MRPCDNKKIKCNIGQCTSDKFDFSSNAYMVSDAISLFGKQTPLYGNSSGSKESSRTLNPDERDLEAPSTPSRTQSTIDLRVKPPLLVPTSVVPGTAAYLMGDLDKINR